jgi:hypothetical protein
VTVTEWPDITKRARLRTRDGLPWAERKRGLIHLGMRGIDEVPSSIRTSSAFGRSAPRRAYVGDIGDAYQRDSSPVVMSTA